jgi:predicted glycoside hydrolase/deacetylase ChbG (UPF0249 family)
MRAHQQGIVTSASLMVRGSAAGAAIAIATRHPRLSLGLHVDLTERVYRDGSWRLAYEVVSIQNEAAVEAETARQLSTFRALTGKNPTHLDSHQHVHRDAPVRFVLDRKAKEMGIPLRHFAPGVTFCGAFYGQSDKGFECHECISVDALIRVIRTLPSGVSELCCHPGERSDTNSVYRHEREVECNTLCDPQVRRALDEEAIELISFLELRR